MEKNGLVLFAVIPFIGKKAKVLAVQARHLYKIIQDIFSVSQGGI